MKSTLVMATLLLFLWFQSDLPAQPRFAVPLRVSDGFNNVTLYFGIIPAGNYCIVNTDCVNSRCEMFLPPIPPVGIFDARFVWPRSGINLSCFDQGSWCDFRAFNNPSQRDTFKVRAQVGMGSALTFCWPDSLFKYFTGLTICGANALVETCLTVSNTSVVCTIISGGLVVGRDEENSREQLPGEFALCQNYPNPFNPSTYIVYRVKSREFVELAVFDLLGRKIATLVNEVKPPGNHDVTWNAEGMTGGVYFYRLQTSNNVQTRKLILLK